MAMVPIQINSPENKSITADKYHTVETSKCKRTPNGRFQDVGFLLMRSEFFTNLIKIVAEVRVNHQTSKVWLGVSKLTPLLKKFAP